MGIITTDFFGSSYVIGIDTFDLPYAAPDDHGATVLGHWDTLAHSVGWSTVSPGVYLLTSPEGLQCRCKISYGTAGAFRLGVQFSSADGSHPGFVHPLIYSYNTLPMQLTLWMNCCSVFTSVPNTPTSGSNYQSAVQGGVIATKAPAGTCVDPAHPLPTATEAWWSSSDHFSLIGTGGAAGLRWSVYRQLYGGYSGCYNGVLNLTGSVSDSNSRTGALTMVIPQAPDWFITHGLYNGMFKFGDINPQLCDAIIAWGDSDTSKCMVRGALYDAVCSTGPAGVDTIEIFGQNPLGDPVYWMAYTGSQPHSGFSSQGSLWLKFPSAAPPENIAY